MNIVMEKRNLTELEIKDILSFIKPRKGVPADVSEFEKMSLFRTH